MKNVKRLLFVFLAALLVLTPFVNVDAAKKKTKTTTTTTTTTTTVKVDENAVVVSVFFRSSCPHCQALHEYLSELKKDSTIASKFIVADYETTQIVDGNEVSKEDVSALLDKVADYFDFHIDGVPFYVIGEKYYSGFGDSSKEELRERILELYNDQEKNIDVVTGISNGSITGKLADKSASNTLGIIILAVSVVVVIVLIILSGKNKYEDDEDEIEDEEEIDEDIEDEEDEEDEEEIKEKVVEKKKKNNKKIKKN